MHVHVQIAHEQIVRRVVRSLKKNVVVRLRQNDVVEAHCTKLKWGALEKTIYHSVATHLVAWPLEVKGTNGGMVRDLFGDEAIVWGNNLVSLSQKRVKGFSCSSEYLSILRYQEYCNISGSLNWIFFSHSSIHELVERSDLWDLLKHTYWFIEPNRHWYLCHILTNRPLEYWPDTETLVLGDQSWQTFSHFHRVVYRNAAITHYCTGRLPYWWLFDYHKWSFFLHLFNY